MRERGKEGEILGIGVVDAKMQGIGGLPGQGGSEEELRKGRGN